MARTQNPSSSSNSKQNENSPLTEEFMKEWFQQQRLKLEIEKNNTKIEELKIQSNERLASKAIDYQARDIKSSPGEFRKHLALIALIVFVFAALLIGIIIYLINQGKDEFANNILKGISYVVVTFLSFWIGRRSKKGDNKNTEYTEIQDVQDATDIT